MINFYLNTPFDESAFLGVHVSPSTKHELCERAHQRGISVSLLVCEILSYMLTNRGYPK